MHFLRTGVDKRLDAHESSHPAATGQIDVVGGFKVIAAVVLAQFGAETDRRYAVAGVVLAPLLINVVELLGTDGVVRLETEVALRQTPNQPLEADFDSASCSAAISSVRVYYSGPSRRRLWNARMAKRET